MAKWFQWRGRSAPGWTFFLILLVAGRVWAEDTKVSFPPAPDWVKETSWTVETNSRATNSSSAGTHWLLYELQERPKRAEEYVRIVESMENASGVQNAGNLRLTFNAEFQELCLHRVVIHRHGKDINRLDQAKVRVIQPESELDDSMITGEKTAVLFIEDLRVGDVLEYAYTLRGANPVLGGHFSNRFIIASESPVDRQLYRVIWDDKTPLHRGLHRTTDEPVIRPFEGGSEYTWSFTNQPAVAYEDDQPASYEPEPYVELSDFDDWGGVVNWALPLYNVPATNVPPDLQELITGWNQPTNTDAEKVQAALQFVQDDLRYTGIELGPDSYQPANPLATFEKRYGDCKGKTVLLRYILQQMQIESYPALVNTFVREGIQNRLPTPFAFNHVILVVELDGKEIWVDPTYSHQGGSLENRYLPPYGKALIVRAGDTALTDVPRSRWENGRVQTATSVFTIKDYTAPVEFTVKTEYHGASADQMRDDIADTAPEELAKNYLNYYTRLYSGVVPGKPMKIKDERDVNVITVEEFYTITNLWKRANPNSYWEATFYADNLYQILSDPNTRIRKTPISLSYPLLRQQEIIVHLPEQGWEIPALSSNVVNDAFEFKYHRHLAGSTVTYEYFCRTKSAAVPVEAVPGYLTDMDHVGDLLSDSLQRSDVRNSGTINWMMVVLAIFSAGAAAFLCVWYWRKTKVVPVAPPVLNNGELQGLGGWLILVGIGICISPIVRIATLAPHWESYFSAQVWADVTMPTGMRYHPLWGPLLIFELLGNVLLFTFNILMIFLYFSKRKAFRSAYVMVLIIQAVFLMTDHFASQLIPALRDSPNSSRHLVTDLRTVFYCIIWTSYVLTSKRVKNTFTR